MFLFLVALATPSEAQLGCFEGGQESFATCSDDSDCVAVGGSECTFGTCLCEEGLQAPFCPCASETPALAPAPAMSPLGLVAVAGLLGATGFLALRRRSGSTRDTSA